VVPLCNNSKREELLALMPDFDARGLSATWRVPDPATLRRLLEDLFGPPVSGMPEQGRDSAAPERWHNDGDGTNSDSAREGDSSDEDSNDGTTSSAEGGEEEDEEADVDEDEDGDEVDPDEVPPSPPRRATPHRHLLTGAFPLRGAARNHRVGALPGRTRWPETLKSP
jgi:hypothetical protein